MKKQNEMNFNNFSIRDDQAILDDILALHSMWEKGLLGGEKMPEDVHPNLPKDSTELMHYLTLGMCLNYQRNSYKLWIACTEAYDNEADRWVFDPISIVSTDKEKLRETLVRHKIALQPNKHIDNWSRVAGGIVSHGEGNIKNIIAKHEYDIFRIRQFVQDNKKDFPYLAGGKICNYWLYVLWQYSSLPIINREALTIAPDTHVMNASLRLGLIDTSDYESSNSQERCVNAWDKILKETSFVPIDIHTPLWLWSRLKFPEIITV